LTGLIFIFDYKFTLYIKILLNNYHYLFKKKKWKKNNGSFIPRFRFIEIVFEHFYTRTGNEFESSFYFSKSFLHRAISFSPPVLPSVVLLRVTTTTTKRAPVAVHECNVMSCRYTAMCSWPAADQHRMFSRAQDVNRVSFTFLLQVRKHIRVGSTPWEYEGKEQKNKKLWLPLLPSRCIRD
jgi:hypothetical protein